MREAILRIHISQSRSSASSTASPVARVSVASQQMCSMTVDAIEVMVSRKGLNVLPAVGTVRAEITSYGSSPFAGLARGVLPRCGRCLADLQTSNSSLGEEAGSG